MQATLARTAVVHDPHPLWLDGLRTVLERAGVEVAATATDERRALELIAGARPDLLVTSSATLVGDLGPQRRPRTILLADSASPEEVEAAFAAGVSAYVLRSAHPDDLVTAVRQTFDQTVYTVSRGHAPAEPTTIRSPGLTRREREILALVAEGRSNGEVAALLWITRQTVKFHLASVYRKLRVGNRTEAGRWAHEHGLLAVRERALAA